MSFTMIACLALLGMFALILLRIPIGVAMGVTGIAALSAMLGFETAVSIVAIEMTSAIASRELGLIPLFLLMGAFATSAGLSDDIYRLSKALIGHFRGGLALTTVATSAGFGAIAGSSIATTSIMGRLAVPQMLKAGYSASFATGSVAGGGTLGILIPPSIIMLLYAFLTEQSVLAMFYAALIPGAITVALYAVAIRVYTRMYPDAGPALMPESWPARRSAAKRFWRAFVLMLCVSGGLYSGVLSVHEAAAVGLAVAFAFFLASKAFGWSKMAQELRGVAGIVAFIFLLVIGANLMTYFMSVSGLPSIAVSWITGLGVPPLATIALILFVMLILGAVFDSIAALVITLPVVLPIVTGLGYDPVWWGIVMVMVIEIGMITPPIGLNVFILYRSVDGIALGTIFRGILPFFIADLIRLGIVVALPGLTMWLPRVAGYL